VTSTGDLVPSAGTVALVTLGCARNEVDSEELAGRLAAAGWEVVDDAETADAVLVNTCGFVDVAKKDSIDAILAASDVARDRSVPGTVVAVGCLAERYGRDLADELPEADAVLGFDDYPDIADRLRRIVQGERPVAHTPSDRRHLLPISPVDRPAVAAVVPGHGDVVGSPSPAPGWQPPVLRRRLDGSPVAPVKLASGCDRRCAFCAIPSFRGSFVSRPAADVLAEIGWLAGQGVREIVLVSENSTSYGKDLGDLRALEALIPQIDALGAVARVRVAYLQPAEVRPGLLTAIARTPVVAPYYDLSFQHASAVVLRRMRRFGGTAEFVDLVQQIRHLDPAAGIRSNVIVGFPGETEADVDELCAFLEEARLDAVGVFGYSDEDGTEAATLPDKVPQDVVDARVERVTALAEEVMAQRAEDRIGERVLVLVEELGDDGTAWGRSAHQGPDDGGTRLEPVDDGVRVGDLVEAVVVSTEGVDLVASPAGRA
jgi:ribosomal protein S12 methylthiotransferase RimO